MSKPFREQACEEFKKAFGQPEVIEVTGGEIYRWILKRKHGNHVFVTIDSPELPDIAHIMISDPSSRSVEPVANMTLRTLEEIKQIIERIRAQWQAPDTASEAPSIGERDSLKRRTG